MFLSGFPAGGTKREDSGRPSANDVRNFLWLTIPLRVRIERKCVLVRLANRYHR